MRNKEGDYVVDRSKISRIIRGPDDIFKWVKHTADYEQEVFTVLVLDGSNKVVFVQEVTKGIVNNSLIHPRETFREAIRWNGVSITLAHNHPSGNLQPSDMDLIVTQKMVSAGQILGIKVLDHLIVSKTGFLSIKDRHPICLQ